jgi:hypothetical protein
MLNYKYKINAENMIQKKKKAKKMIYVEIIKYVENFGVADWYVEIFINVECKV